jgi:hypothetical protein
VGCQFLRSGLVLSAVVLTGLSTPSSTAQPATFAQSQPLAASQRSTAVAALSAVQDAISDPGISRPTKSLSEPAATLPDPTVDEGNRANEESNAIAAIVSEMPGFGGIWVDKAGITHVAVQHGKTRDFAKALEERPRGEHVLDEVDFSYDDLALRAKSISKHMGVLKALGLNLLEWGPDEKKNTVWITLRDYSEEKAARARKILGEDILVSAATVAGDENDLFSRTGDYPPFVGWHVTAAVTAHL